VQDYTRELTAKQLAIGDAVLSRRARIRRHRQRGHGGLEIVDEWPEVDDRRAVGGGRLIGGIAPRRRRNRACQSSA
jgi:hypothetical protein